MTPLRRDEQALLRQLADWQILRFLGWPDTGWQHEGGQSTAQRGSFIRYGRSAVVLEEAGEAVVTVTWRRAAAYAASLDSDLTRRLREHCQAHRQQQIDYPPFYATGIALGCGPTIRDRPTLAQLHYMHQYDVWRDERYLPWLAARQALEALTCPLLDEALPLAASTEPTDLLELLALEVPA